MDPRRRGNAAENESGTDRTAPKATLPYQPVGVFSDHSLGTRRSKYTKTRWAANSSGQDYEVVLNCLIFLRALRFCSDFVLASNHAGAGRFDDVVLIYRLAEDDVGKYRAILLQAKHRDDVKSQPFHLSMYFKSFKKIRNQWQPLTEVDERQVDVQEVTLVLYTNGTRGPSGVSTRNASTDDNASVARHLRDLLHTKGYEQRFLDSSQVGLREGGETSDFLGRLLVCSGQMCNVTADGFLEDELRKVLKLRKAEDARSLSAEFKRLVKGWWSEKEKGRYLSQHSAEWNKILALHLERLNEGIKISVRLLGVGFSAEAIDEIIHLLGATKKIWFSAEDKYRATVTKVRLFKAKDSVLFLDGNSAEDSFEQVEALWGTDACGTVVVDLTTTDSPSDHPVAFLVRLEAVVRCHRGRWLVVIANQSPTGSDWTVSEPGATWSYLDVGTKRRLLSKRVVLQGREVALMDVVGSDVDEVMSDRVIESLCQAATTVKLGDGILSPLTYYVPRCLERIYRSGYCFFDSLIRPHTLIGFNGNIPYHITKSNITTYSQLGELERRLKVPRSTIITEALSKHEFRKLCGKYCVRGIWGFDGFILALDVTEFIPLTWTSEERIIIVEGDPGIGKSAFVTWMCAKVKERFPDAWVLRINMGENSEFIKRSDFDDNAENVMEFLRRGLSPTRGYLEDHLLDYSLLVSGNVFLFLDAFDEVSPDYTSKYCVLLSEIIKRIKFRQMVVTTRKVTTEILEETLKSKAFTLPVFTEEEIGLFFRNFLVKHDQYVDVSEISETFGQVLEIPLFCKIGAEAIQQKAKKMLNNGVNPWNKVLLYQLLIDKVVKQRLVEKFGLDPYVAEVEGLFKNYKSIHYEIVKRVAATSRLPREEYHKMQLQYHCPSSKSGIIVGYHLEFEHKTFEDFFFGLWIAENWERCSARFLGDVLFRPDMELVTTTFNWRLFEECSLHVAVARGDMDSLRELLDSPCINTPLIKMKDLGGRFPLHVAAMTQGNHREIWELLMSAGQDLKKKDDVLQLSAMNYAETTGQWEMVDFVLEKGADISYLKFVIDKDAAKKTLFEAINRDLRYLFQYLLRLDKEIIENRFGDLSDTPLHIAAAAGSTRIVKALIELRRPVNDKNLHRITPLLYSSKFGHGEIIRLLLQNGADIKIRTKSGNVALIDAAAAGHLEAVRILLRYTSDIDAKGYKGNTALLLASGKGYLETVSLLLSNGAGINVRNVYGVTPLMEASRKGHTEVVRILLQHGLSGDVEDKHGYIATLHAYKDSNRKQSRKLLNIVADINEKDNVGLTALQKASAGGHLNILKMLIGKGADVSSKNYFGVAALQLAATMGHCVVVRVLVENGAHVNDGDQLGVSVLMSAAEGGHCEIVKMLLERGAVVDESNNLGVTALHKAAIEGHVEVVKTLLDYDADVNGKDFSGVTALHKASAEGHLKVVKLILNYGGNIFEQDKYGATPLDTAAAEIHWEVANFLTEYGLKYYRRCHTENVDVVKKLQWKWKNMKVSFHRTSCEGLANRVTKLLENGAHIGLTDVFFRVHLAYLSMTEQHRILKVPLMYGKNVDEKDCYGSTALHMASSWGDSAAVRILLDHGADVHIKDNDGRTALGAALRAGCFGVVRTLLDYGAELYESYPCGVTALQKASKEGCCELVKILLERGDDIDEKNNLGFTALHEAAWEGNNDVVSYLTEYGANVDAKDDHGATALHRASTRGHCHVVSLLLDCAAVVNARDASGVSPLHVASSEGHLRVVRTLLANGARVNAKDTSGATALHRAAAKGHLGIASELLTWKADVNAGDIFGVTALQVASKEGRPRTARLLLEHGADVSATDFFGGTALQVAAAGGRLEVVNLLILHGADVNGKDRSGKTALHEAAAGGHLEVARTLLTKGAEINARDCNGATALWRASANRRRNVVGLLLPKKIEDFHVIDAIFFTSFILLTAEGCLDVAEALAMLAAVVIKKIFLYASRR